MSVMLVTSLGDIVIDLFADSCPLTCKNFLKLCKIKYYNGCLFHTVQKDFTAQTGDPTGTGSGGDSAYKRLYGEQARFFGDEIRLDLKHSRLALLPWLVRGRNENLNASQFYFMLRDDLDFLDGKHTVFGELAEGLDMLNRINEAYVDENNRPYKNIRIKHTYIIDDPFDDPPALAELIPDASPEGKPNDEVDDVVRLEDDWVPMDETLGVQQLGEVLHEKEARSRTVLLESIGDIPEAEIKPPDNVLFVCQLNSVTKDEGLYHMFSRFGTVTSADIICDHKTGDSLGYAFIEFKDPKACKEAYKNMAGVKNDDRRIHVDFSQSVTKLWPQYRRHGQTNRVKGCFKCGSLDHIAKDCTGDRTNIQHHSKYVLKDGNAQHGNSSQGMVFEEDDFHIPKRDKLQRDNETEKDKKGLATKRRYNEARDRRNKINHSHKYGERSRDQQDTNKKCPRDRKSIVRDRDYRAKEEEDPRRKEYGGSDRNRREDGRHEKRHDNRDDKPYERKDSDDMVHQHPSHDNNSQKSYDGRVFAKINTRDEPYNRQRHDIANGKERDGERNFSKRRVKEDRSSHVGDDVHATHRGHLTVACYSL